jgi:hypothetical protein
MLYSDSNFATSSSLPCCLEEDVENAALRRMDDGCALSWKTAGLLERFRVDCDVRRAIERGADRAKDRSENMVMWVVRNC